MSGPEEYEVETVIQARVASKRKDKINWKYLVKWKGYSIDDATWEPPSSFNGGSEHMLTRFWERVGGRDMNDASLFKTGEEVYPQGPPRKAKRKKATQEGRDEEPTAPTLVDGPEAKNELDKESKKSEKRRRSPENDEPVKRKRGADSESATKPKRKSPSHINGDDEGLSQRGSSPGPSTKYSGKASGGTLGADITLASPSANTVNQPLTNDQSPSAVPSNGDVLPDDLGEVEDQQADDDSDDPLFDSPKADHLSLPRRSTSANDGSASLPSHRARAANPLIKVVDDPNLRLRMDSAIAAKARLASHDEDSSNGSSSRAASKPGPARSQGLQTKNRSSLLVFQKGSLQTRKGKYRPSDSNPDASPNGQTDQDDENSWGGDAMLVDDILALDPPPVKVPTGQELLQMAGLDEADAAALPDFEDDGPEEVASAPMEASAQHSLAQAVGNLFPSKSSSSLSSSFNSSWKRSTIFGPLGFGTSAVMASSERAASTSAPASTRATFSLSLDSSVTVPIILKDVYQVTGSPSLDAVVAANPKGPPGKFYREEVASTLLNTLRSGGSSARVEFGESMDENHKQHFERFRGRLEAGELFVGLAGHDVLVFWSSGNANVGQILGTPEMLVGLPGTVVVSRVVIENYSAYADVACQAEHVRW